MKFLIDECLHTSLVRVATARNHEATHVTYRGWSGVQDWNLIGPIVNEDLTFVTNNARDFRRLHGRVPLHSGLIILLPHVPPPRQRRLFDAALDALAELPDLINQALELDFDGEDIVIERFVLPRI